MANRKYEYIKNEFEVEDHLLPSTWIVVRIDGRHFHKSIIRSFALQMDVGAETDDRSHGRIVSSQLKMTPSALVLYIEKFAYSSIIYCRDVEQDWDGFLERFSDVHEFEKPNDPRALNLMNSCAVSVLEEFADTVCAYGVSDEYSFVFNKTSQIYQRRASKIVSAIVSFFSSLYVIKWKEFFPQQDLKSIPSFDGRAVCYPSNRILRDYLAWRQVDCHINNQYNTCFWTLVKSGKKNNAAAKIVKDTRNKNEFLEKIGIDYKTLPAMYRKGSFVFRAKVDETLKHEEHDELVNRLETKVVAQYCDLIEDNFWNEHPSLIGSD